MILGLGVDLVAVPEFARQLEVPGTRFLDVFTGAERRAAQRRAAQRRMAQRRVAQRRAAEQGVAEDSAVDQGAAKKQVAAFRGDHSGASPDDPGGGSIGTVAHHYAARWAAKEAFVKAWSAAIAGQGPPIAPSDLVWREIEVYSDAWSRPLLRLHGAVAREVQRTLGPISGATGQETGSAGQKSGSAGQETGSTGQETGSAGQKSGSAGQETGSERQVRIHLSMSHDGDFATATVIIERV